ncbi:hypothetical protein BT96DRAFT_998143 [Gymnopus androsaceus JB14]|uniref:Uncharacterized protein n=1 Tax=Gymnopus androsaceus JB14 TaxID=1447944 RepID=A0A6A4HAM3_9AGAR|nr:hypothetical protein BT96DRAFT_998143 [Gymnopus androsaceus JB14]
MNPDCPDAVRLLKGLFDRCFIPVNGTDNSDEFVQRKGTHRAYVAHDGGKLSPFDTHKGNSTIIYRPLPSSPPVAPEGQNTGVRLHVRPHEPLSKALHDPFLKYPHFNARTYSSTLREAEDIIELDDVVSPAARYDYSYGRILHGGGSMMMHTVRTSSFPSSPVLWSFPSVKPPRDRLPIFRPHPVVVAVSSAELVYFELDLEGQLNEYQDQKAMGSTVLALSIAERRLDRNY